MELFEISCSHSQEEQYVYGQGQNHLHWQRLLVKPLATATCDNKIEIDYLCCTAQGGQGQYNSYCRLSGRWHYHAKALTM